MGRNNKKVNEHFFDTESRDMEYILGASYQCYILHGDRGFIFRSRHKDLVQILKTGIESEHTIVSDTRGRSSYWIEINGVLHLNHRLGELGLNVPKSERVFPEISSQSYASNFARGFIDAAAHMSVIDGKRTRIKINFNQQFLYGLHKLLSEYAGVVRDDPKTNSLVYSHKDSIKIHNLIYQDEEVLYIASKKRLYLTEQPVHAEKRAVRRRINEAQRLVLTGLPTREIAARLGYSHLPSFYNAFKNVTGQTLGRWVKQTGH